MVSQKATSHEKLKAISTNDILKYTFMTEEREIIILKKSIQMLHEFVERVEYVNSGREYISIHNRNVETISKIAIERNSDYLKIKLAEYPKINIQEVDDYIKTKKKDINIVFIIFNFFGAFIIDRIIRFAKTKGSTPEIIKEKIQKIDKINGEILKVIENSYLETLYK